jgi:hypothetical protein
MYDGCPYRNRVLHVENFQFRKTTLPERYTGVTIFFCSI